MHSWIIQVSNQPIKKEDYITEDLFYDGFVGNIADYVNKLNDEEATYFKNNIGQIEGLKVDGRAFSVVDKDKFFEKRYKEFTSSVEKLSNVTFEEFKNDPNYSVYTNVLWTMDAYEDEYGIYVYLYIDGGCYSYMPLSKFIRRYVKSPREKWYIGGVIDYHF